MSTTLIKGVVISMSGYTDFGTRMRTGITYVADAEVDVQEWDDWFTRYTYELQERLPLNKLGAFCIALQRLFQQGKLEGYNFLFAMCDYDRERWIYRTQRECRRLHALDPSGFPAGGIKDSFDRIRAIRKANRKPKER